MVSADAACGEPEQEAVAELLHDAGTVGQATTDHALLRSQQQQCIAVTSHGGELGEAADVGERDGTREHVGVENGLAPGHRHRTVIPPERVRTATEQS